MPVADEEFEKAVQDCWGRMDPPGGMATRWFLTVEGLGSEGTRCLCYVWSSDVKTWDVKGMLREAIDDQVTGQVADEIRGE